MKTPSSPSPVTIERACELNRIWNNDAPDGMAYACPDCPYWATLGGNAGFHMKGTGHGVPVLLPLPTIVAGKKDAVSATTVQGRHSTSELPDNAAVEMYVEGGRRYVKWVGGNDIYDAPNWVWQLVHNAERATSSSPKATESADVTTDLGEKEAVGRNTHVRQMELSLVDQVAIEVAYCRHVKLTVHETSRRVIAIIKPKEALESADSAVRAGLRIEERMRSEMQAMNDRWARLHKELDALPDDIEKMVNRFLAWPLPESVCSDQCVTDREAPHRSGTNLLTADEARQMVEYILVPSVPHGTDEQPAAQGSPTPSVPASVEHVEQEKEETLEEKET